MNLYRIHGLALVFLSFVALSLAAQPPGGQGKIIEREAFKAAQTVSPDQLPRIDHGDGTWSYAPVKGFDPNTRVRGALITWRYDGQARFAHVAKPVSSTRRWVATQDLPVEPTEQLMSMLRIDRWGRRWKADSVNQNAWRAAIEAENRKSEEDGDEPGLVEKKGEPAAKPGTVVEWQPQSWTHSNCDSAGPVTNETHLWEGESRTAVGTPDEWERTAVQISAAGICTGTILTQRFILTAAHCVSDDSNNPVPNNTIQVCRQDTSACLGVVDVQFPNSYGGGSGTGGGTDFSDDWALLELSSTWVAAGSTRAGDMDLSRARDSTLDALTRVNNLGFPGFAPGCGSANGNTLFHNDEAEPLTATFRKTVRMKIDGTPGHSGGPDYYCPKGNNNTCSGGDHGFIFAVQVGYNSAAKRMVGPKVSFFRDAAIAIIVD